MKTFFYSTFTILFSQLLWASTNTHKINLVGVVTKTDGSPVTANSVTFTVEVLSPNSSLSSSNECLLYRETHTPIDLSTTNGKFNLIIGSGSAISNAYSAATPGEAFKKVFINSGTNTTGLSCQSGSSYQSAIGDSRFVRIKFNDGSGERTVTPYHELKSVPFAFSAENSETLGGLEASDFAVINKTVSPSVGQTLAFIGGKWTPANDAVGILAESDPLVKTFAKTNLPTCGPGQVLNSDGTNLTCVVDDTGAVPPDATTTSKGAVQVGAGLTVSGGVLSVGQIEISNVNGLSTELSNKLSKSQLPSPFCSSAETIYFNTVSDRFECQSISINAAAVSGNITGNAAGFTGSLSGDVSGTQSSTVVARIHGRNVANTTPTVGQVLKWDGTQWAPGSDIDTNSGGTVTNISTGVGLIGGPITTTGTISVDVGTTANKIVQLDSNGRIPALDGSLITNLNASAIAGSISTSIMPALTGDISSNAGSNVVLVTGLQGVPIKSGTPTDGQVIKYNSTTSQWEFAPDLMSGGTITSISTGNGLIGGPITSTGTISVDVGTTANKVVQLDSSGRLPAVDASLVTGVFDGGKLQSRNISSAVPALGSFLKWNSSLNQWEPASLPNCTASQSIYFNSGTDSYACQNITITGAAVSGNIAGNSGGFTGTLSGDVTGTQLSTIVGKIQGRSVANTAPTTGQVLKWNGSAWAPENDTDTNSGGTVTSIATGTGLVGGPITSTGTISVDVGTTANKIVQLDSSARIPAVNGSQITNINGSNISSGTVATAHLGTGSPSTTTFLRGDGTWGNPSNSAAIGRTTCPSGFSLIGTSGDPSAFCISSTERPATNWAAAVTNCYNTTPRSQLCSIQEWAMSCVSTTVAGMTGNWEWVADFGYNASNAVVMGSSSCSSASISAPSNDYGYRCCLK